MVTSLCNLFMKTPDGTLYDRQVREEAKAEEGRKKEEKEEKGREDERKMQRILEDLYGYLSHNPESHMTLTEIQERLQRDGLQMEWTELMHILWVTNKVRRIT